jgi:hypothetical protein
MDAMEINEQPLDYQGIVNSEKHPYELLPP